MSAKRAVTKTNVALTFWKVAVGDLFCRQRGCRGFGAVVHPVDVE